MNFSTFSSCGLIVLFAILVRWSVSLNEYSGFGKPPMYGDYEAQRHWMEITVNLPPQQWYKNSSDNDLQYWGLDYPPLTAYHSWLCGLVASKINSSWVELKTSRGMESSTHKLFMRYTVLLVDVLIYFPAVFVYFFTSSKAAQDNNKWWYTFSMLLYPGLILIDHGHFQYNCVSLGLALWGVIGLCRGHDLLGSIAFVLALNYKQMELYHAMPFFCYLLGSCFRGKTNWFLKLLQLGVVVVSTMALCWLPFLRDFSLATQVLNRIFPFARGLYEDKIANVWCTLSVLIKLKQIFDITTLVKISLGSTIVLLLPSNLHLLWRPSLARFKLALVNSSLIFFLFSFQVHEKSILLVSLPVCLLLPEFPFASMWFLMISTFSMLPLLIKDQLLLPSVASSLMFYLLWSFIVNDSLSLSDDLERKQAASSPGKMTKKAANSTGPSTLWYFLFCLSMLGAATLTVCSVTVVPPARFPDLFPVLVSGYACVHFVLFLGYFHWLQFSCSDVDIPADKTVALKSRSPSKKQSSKQLKRKKND